MLITLVSICFFYFLPLSEPEKLKRTNSLTSATKLSSGLPRGTVAVSDFWDYVSQNVTSRAELVQQFKVDILLLQTWVHTVSYIVQTQMECVLHHYLTFSEETTSGTERNKT